MVKCPSKEKRPKYRLHGAKVLQTIKGQKNRANSNCVTRLTAIRSGVKKIDKHLHACI